MLLTQVIFSFDSKTVILLFSVYRDLKAMGLFIKESDTSANAGWYRFYSHLFASSSHQQPSIAFGANAPMFSASCASGKSYAFKDMTLTFSQKLSNPGLNTYSNIDNQYNKKRFQNVSRAIFGKISDTDRAALSFTWKLLENIPQTFHANTAGRDETKYFTDVFNSTTVTVTDNGLYIAPISLDDIAGNPTYDVPAKISIDHGESFRDQETTIVVLDPSHPQYRIDVSQFYRSTDGGFSWQSVLSGDNFSSFVVDESGNVLVAGADTVYVSMHNGTEGSFVGNQVPGLGQIAANKGTAYAVSLGSQLSVSTPTADGVGTYFDMSNTITAYLSDYGDNSDIYRLLVDRSGYNAYVYTTGQKLYRANTASDPLVLLQSFEYAGGGNVAIDKRGNIFVSGPTCFLWLFLLI